jgi:NADH kinase
VRIIAESHVAERVHNDLSTPIYSIAKDRFRTEVPSKTDFAITLGGDGTILHAASLFSTTSKVPPILSFSMGTLGFLGEWKFSEHKRAFREVFMSGADASYGTGHKEGAVSAWSELRGKAMGSNRAAKVLRRKRLEVSICDSSGAVSETNDSPHLHAMNEVIVHRGRSPHLAILEVLIGGRLFTEAVGDGMIVSTPTGSTAYSLSSGGSIVHPLVSSIMLTPVCPRSLSFRPLVLPANTAVTLRLSEKNRAGLLDISIDGVHWGHGLRHGMEVRVCGEQKSRQDAAPEANGRGPLVEWQGGIPCITRGGDDTPEVDGWVGGLNGLLKFNHPFGEDA